jgi:translocation and assembly module TamA
VNSSNHNSNIHLLLKSPLFSIFVLLTTLLINPNVGADDHTKVGSKEELRVELKVEIEGVDKELLKNIKSSLTIVKKASETPKDQLTDQMVKSSYAQATEQTKQALRPFGFYQPSVLSNLSKKDKHWLASFQIDKGPQSLIRNVVIDINGVGKTEASIQPLINNPTIKQGDKLDHRLYSEYKQTLYDSLFDIGYIDALYQKSEMRVDIKNNQADIILILETGPQYFFGKINIQQSVIKPEKIKKIVSIDDDNTPFNTDRLIQLQLKLSDTGYFASTDIRIERDQTVNQSIPVTIITTPSKKLKYSTSIGYGTDTGARLGLSVLNRRVNKSGHRRQYSAQLSEIESNAAARYIIPIGNINTEYVELFSNVHQEIVNDTDTTQYSVGTSMNQNRWGGRRRLSLTLLQEQFSFDEKDDQKSSLLIPGLVYNYKKADKVLFARSGYSFTGDFHGGIESNISETSFFHSRISGRSIFPLGSKTRLLNRLELGAIISDEFEELPPSERFFTGGSQSVRGYDYKDIGPRNILDNNIGGKYLIASSIEVDYLAWGNLGFALFYDVGDATSDNNFSLKTAAGLGFRYRSVIGMVRIDLAHPFEHPDKEVRLHISIGPDL